MMYPPFFSPFGNSRRRPIPPSPSPAMICPPPREPKKEVSVETPCDTGEKKDFFEIFGLKLYFDDLILLGMLFLLYKEESEDTYLYIALVLLLLG